MSAWIKSLPVHSQRISQDPKFDDSRISDHPDKYLLEKIREYFHNFTHGNFDAIKAGESDDYTMTDIPIGALRMPRDTWYYANMGFTQELKDLRVIAISLDGSSAPGHFSILEHLVQFSLINDPHPDQLKHLPPGTKAGDELAMINIAVLYWDGDGKICHELEYGRMTWPGFDLDEFFKAKEQEKKTKYGWMARIKA